MLQGIRVVELATYVAGPGACGLLADWGAEVIKIEAPGGDPFRGFYASVGRDDGEGQGCAYRVMGGAYGVIEQAVRLRP